ncbi:MAG: ATP synthase F1 subunit gamma [Bacteroidales bacterium]|nr:ATP synthase F1 subunit gamma [Bacteroidales bacterium]
MASLREIKDRIGSVRSTLKITSAMKLVASAKLRKAQRAIEALRPYECTLAEILATVNGAGTAAAPAPLSGCASLTPDPTRVNGYAGALPLPASPSFAGLTGESPAVGKTAIVAIASNSSLCGGFNANAARLALETIRACEGDVEVYPLGRKMAEALKRAGYVADQDYNDLIAHPSYDKSAGLARALAERFQAGEIARVVIIYNRFVSASSQEPVAEQYLPFAAPVFLSESEGSPAPADYILEPDAEALVAQLLPQVMLLKFHAAILDSSAAEQAARTLAMQTASDNAEDLLGELTLEYNKGRQQKITAEILDLLGGASGQ